MKPTAQSTQYLFERCLDLLMGVHTTQIEEVRDKMLQNVEHPVSIMFILRCANASAD
jgi:Nuf2 family